ncbi:ATP-dependent endonuclease [Streptomyces sp. R302]|uniref:TOPRIM nucleotidyl transferase/hydrolase domain-containing protein n=1 Tax=unclassified Streptomyces TaxID=2593676 RepID=UPI00145E8F24|nr:MULTISPECIES: TOPRIM nucleotidyl transferase/hydrolase domain-containing protein [unclassified Streptomyces]NML51980.1 ATP-dependent endonuclease [Streptomyces sp. R301]NML81600.1 ATP-dependent endonuclease [Streptomyces sp. R302]
MTDMDAFRSAVAAWAAGGTGDAARELAARLPVHTVVLLEGRSDVAAVEALAARRGRDLAAEGVCALSMNGVTNAARHARLLGPPGLGLRLTGLCDDAERAHYARGLAAAGADPEAFFVCVADLEDELIRALGVDRVGELVVAEGEGRALRTFLNQPAQRDRSPLLRMRRFLGTTSGRKIRYGRILVDGLDLTRVPAPLDGLLASL